MPCCNILDNKVVVSISICLSLIIAAIGIQSASFIVIKGHASSLFEPLRTADTIKSKTIESIPDAMPEYTKIKEQYRICHCIKQYYKGVALTYYYNYYAYSICSIFSLAILAIAAFLEAISKIDI
jgi:hypothetical protein